VRHWEMVLTSVARREAVVVMREAQVLIEQWRVYYNTIRPRQSDKLRANFRCRVGSVVILKPSSST